MSTAKLSILIPCLNEAGTIEECVTRARMVLDNNGIDGEVIVIDNDSDDGSAAIARYPAPQWCKSRGEATGRRTWPGWRLPTVTTF